MKLNLVESTSEYFMHKAQKIEDSYIEACEWIQSLGIDYKRTRFGEYERDFKRILKDDVGSEAREQVIILMNAYLEASELIRVMNIYRSFDTKQTTKLMRKMASGQRFRNSTLTDQSRDFAFELGVASRFIKAGYEVDLTGVSDMVVDIYGRRLYIECKRIKSDKQLHKRIKEANVQIKTRLSNDHSSKSRGFIALNITDLIIKENPTFIFSRIEEYKHASTATLLNFCAVNQVALNENRVKGCLGILVEFTTQGGIFSEDSGDFSLANIREANLYLHRLLSEEKEFVDSFWQKLGKQDLFI